MNSLLANAVSRRGSRASNFVEARPSRTEILFIDKRLVGEIVSHVQRCLPDEGVGLLATRWRAGGRVAATFYPGTNIARSATRFVMAPSEVRHAIEDMERRGTMLGAIVHSHPRTAAEPSRIDLREATLSDALSVIVGFQPCLSIRAWRLLFNASGAAFDAVECPMHGAPAQDRLPDDSCVMADRLIA